MGSLDDTSRGTETTGDEDAPPAPPAEGAFAPGAALAGRYRVIRLVARGGMGEVYEVEDTLLGGRVALKALRAHLADDERAQERLRREVTLARRITHPNVCRLFDSGVHDGLPFLTMELLPGETLAERLARGGPLDEAGALPIAAGLAAALDAAHEAGVLHRDFKCGNIILCPDGRAPRPVVTDFGLAREEIPDEGARVTREGSFLGTPAYVAPEQVEGGAVTPRTDVYSFGVVLFEMMTGTLPWRGDTDLAVATSRIRRAPPSPRGRKPSLDQRWEEVIVRCLAPAPEDRPAGAGAAMAQLRAPARRRGWARWLAAPVLAAIAIAAAMAVPREADEQPRLHSPPSPAVRRAVAVIGEDGAALETIRLSIGGDRIRLAGDTTVAEARRDLVGDLAELQTAAARARVASVFGVDNLVVVAGGEVLLAGDDGRALGRWPTAGAVPALLHALGATGQAPSGRPPAAGALAAYARGAAAMRENRVTDAAEELTGAAAVDPTNLAIAMQLAGAAFSTGDRERAAAELRRAEGLTAGLSVETRLLVHTHRLEAERQREAAIFTAQGLLAMVPDALESGLLLAQLQSRATRPRDARVTLERLRQALAPRDDVELDKLDLHLASDLGDPRSELTIATRIVRNARALGRKMLLADSLRKLAGAQADLGDLELARSTVDASVATCEATRAPETCRAPVLLSRAVIAGDQGALAVARADVLRAVETAGGSQKLLDAAARALVWIELRSGDLAAAGALLDGKLAGSASLEVLLLRADLAAARGDLDAARAASGSALEILRETDNNWMTTYALLSLGHVEVAAGRPAAARLLVQEAITTLEALGYQTAAARGRRLLAEIALAAGDAAGAELEANRALDELGRRHALDDEAAALVVAVRARARLGRADEARALAAPLATRPIETFEVRLRARAAAGGDRRALADEARRAGWTLLARELSAPR